MATKQSACIQLLASDFYWFCVIMCEVCTYKYCKYGFCVYVVLELDFCVDLKAIVPNVPYEKKKTQKYVKGNLKKKD